VDGTPIRLAPLAGVRRQLPVVRLPPDTLVANSGGCRSVHEPTGVDLIAPSNRVGDDETFIIGGVRNRHAQVGVDRPASVYLGPQKLSLIPPVGVVGFAAV
jgi:hypothetical protein